MKETLIDLRGTTLAAGREARPVERATSHAQRRPAMKIADAMTRDVRVATPDQSIREAAQLMAELDAGAVPVRNQDRLVGMITDRDIAVRAVAESKSPDTRIQHVMTRDVKYCFDDDELEDVARNMADLQARRLPVVNRDKRLVGIIALSDIAAAEDADVVGDTVSGISERSRQR
jgi:CBS domain-containing protein